jgi:O-antigen ligase
MQLTKIYNYSFILVACFPLFTINNSKYIIIFWAISAAFVVFKNKTYLQLEKVDIRNILILSLYYIFLILNYLFSNFNDEILRFLETGALLAIFPFFIILNKTYIEDSTLTNSITAFFISNIILAFSCWYKIFNIGYFNLLEQDNYYQPVFRNLFSDTTATHLPYLGLLFVFSIFVGIYFILKQESKRYIKVLLILGCLVLFISILTFSARMSLLTVILVGVFIMYSKIKSKVVKIILPIFVIGICLCLVYITPIKQRAKEFFETKLELPSEDFNDKSHLVNFRYGIYYCALNILKDNFIFGIGKNNVSKEMSSCYKTFTYSNFDDFEKRDYNTHNQYLDIIISFGIFGFLLLFVSLFFGLYKNQNELYKVFLAIIFMALLTENLFERQLGVVFFAFFNSLFFIKREKT